MIDNWLRWTRLHWNELMMGKGWDGSWTNKVYQQTFRLFVFISGLLTWEFAMATRSSISCDHILFHWPTFQDTRHAYDFRCWYRYNNSTSISSTSANWNENRCRHEALMKLAALLAFAIYSDKIRSLSPLSRMKPATNRN